MAKFKTRGGKTVVFGSEAIGIDDPLLGFGIALGGKKPTTTKEIRAKVEKKLAKEKKERVKERKKRLKKVDKVYRRGWLKKYD